MALLTAVRKLYGIVVLNPKPAVAEDVVSVHTLTAFHVNGRLFRYNQYFGVRITVADIIVSAISNKPFK